MLECPKCGYNNELGRIFCHSCGTKLDLTQIKAPTAGAKMRRRVQRNVTRTIRTLVEMAITGVILLGIVMICLTPEVKPVKATNAELMTYDAKRDQLDKVVNKPKGGKVVLSEAELNVFLNSYSFEKPTGKGIEVTPAALRASLADGAVKIQFLGVIHFGGVLDKQLYLGYECTPVIAGGECVFRPTAGWLGKLPLHPKLLIAAPFMDNYFGHLFSKLTDEKRLLDQLTSITVTKDAVTLEKTAAH